MMCYRLFASLVATKGALLRDYEERHKIQPANVSVKVYCVYFLNVCGSLCVKPAASEKWLLLTKALL